jgi:hypothetical protein
MLKLTDPLIRGILKFIFLEILGFGRSILGNAVYLS